MAMRGTIGCGLSRSLAHKHALPMRKAMLYTGSRRASVPSQAGLSCAFNCCRSGRRQEAASHASMQQKRHSLLPVWSLFSLSTPVLASFSTSAAVFLLLQAVDSVAAEQGVVKAVDPTKALQQKLEFLKREEAAIRAELARSEEAEKAAAKSAAAKKIVRRPAPGPIKEHDWAGSVRLLSHCKGLQKAGFCLLPR
eukprot:1141573-Pelagomonas_calceolata.AAC.4